MGSRGWFLHKQLFILIRRHANQATEQTKEELKRLDTDGGLYGHQEVALLRREKTLLKTDFTRHRRLFLLVVGEVYSVAEVGVVCNAVDDSSTDLLHIWCRLNRCSERAGRIDLVEKITDEMETVGEEY